ncbi:cell division protein ZapD [Ferrimonas pelagia]|uniref:Cell division protein ZapD n=1 Tax=Ferrimonas pelagia TaxID=1177826 RepID=A0ABP9FHQ1_9GAMM
MWLVFEQPLNEKIRNYLRIESVCAQLDAHQGFPYPGSELAFFRSLFELAELLERADLRTDVGKDLERQRQQLQLWRPLPDVDQQQLDAFEHQLDSLQQQLQQMTRPTQLIKSDRFLAALRQRLTIPGGYGSFDLPQLHFWLASEPASKTQQAQRWRQRLTPITEAVALLLNMLRETGRWQEQIAMGGSYQASSEQELDLLRVKLKQTYGVYPTISAHRSRFTIHLINNETGKADNRNLPLHLCLSMENR